MSYVIKYNQHFNPLILGIFLIQFKVILLIKISQLNYFIGFDKLGICFLYIRPEVVYHKYVALHFIHIICCK